MDNIITAWCLIKDIVFTEGIRLISQTVLNTNKTQIIPCASCFNMKPRNPFLPAPATISGEISDRNAAIKKTAIKTVARFRRNHTFFIPEKSLLYSDKSRMATPSSIVEHKISRSCIRNDCVIVSDSKILKQTVKYPGCSPPASFEE